MIGLFLVYPALRTLVLSFANEDSTAWVGFSNYADLLSSRDFIFVALLNTLLWIAVVPVAVVVIGLFVAVLADRLGPRTEKATKSVIFLPMAISMVGAATIWGFVYAVRPRANPRSGCSTRSSPGSGSRQCRGCTRHREDQQLHANGDPDLDAGRVRHGPAVGRGQSVPDDTLEAARIDGANERQVFFRVIVPQIWPTVITVFITMVILVMKVFDIIYVMTGGNFRTDVIALQFFNELFSAGNAGRAAAIVVMLMIAVIPIA